jgi:hypothetical protein
MKILLIAGFIGYIIILAAVMGFRPFVGSNLSKMDQLKITEYNQLIELQTQNCIPQGSEYMCAQITNRLGELTK